MNTSRGNSPPPPKQPRYENGTKPKVHFATGDQLEKVIVFEDDEASVEMRSCYWELLDRARFHDRIKEVAEVLNPVLDFEKRRKVYLEQIQKSSSSIPEIFEETIKNQNKVTPN